MTIIGENNEWNGGMAKSDWRVPPSGFSNGHLLVIKTL